MSRVRVWIIAFVLCHTGAAVADEPIVAVNWTFSNLDEIAGHKTTVIGSPRIIDSPQGKAVEFDGQSAIFLDVNPLAGLDQFTAESL